MVCFYILAETEGMHSAWYWALGSTFVAICTGSVLVYRTIKTYRGVDQDRVVGQYELLLAEHKRLLKEREARDGKQAKKIEELEKLIGDVRAEHRKEMDESWEEHSKCLKRENRIRMRLDSYEKALREAEISFDVFVDEDVEGGTC